jgi:hypothetical protein
MSLNCGPRRLAHIFESLDYFLVAPLLFLCRMTDRVRREMYGLAQSTEWPHVRQVVTLCSNVKIL